MNVSREQIDKASSLQKYPSNLSTTRPVLNDWFAFVVAVRKVVVIPICVKDLFYDGALHPPAPIHGLFFSS